MVYLLTVIPISGQTTATASVTISDPLSVVKSTDLNFGYLMSGSTAGTVTISTAGVRSKTGGVTLVEIAGKTSAATFVLNAPNKWKWVTVPSSITLTRVGGSGTMTVNTFTRNPSGPGQQNAGIQTISLGAKLTVPANQAQGVYVSTEFTVTVNFS